MIQDSRVDCDHLTIILHADVALIENKGYFQLNETDRATVLMALPEVDRVEVASHCDQWTTIPSIEALVKEFPRDRIVIFNGPGVTPDLAAEVSDGATYIYTLKDKSYSTTELFDAARTMRMRGLPTVIDENDYVVLDDCQTVDHPEETLSD